MAHTHSCLNQTSRKTRALCAMSFLLAVAASAAPSLSLSSASGPPTTNLTVSGTGFAADALIDVYFGTWVRQQPDRSTQVVMHTTLTAKETSGLSTQKLCRSPRIQGTLRLVTIITVVSPEAGVRKKRFRKE